MYAGVKQGRKTAPLQLWVGRVPSCDENAFSLLSPDEQQRLNGLAFADLKRLFLNRRVWLRRMLAGVIGVSAQEVRFDYDVMGKPSIKNMGQEELHFSFSHSGPYVALAVNRAGLIGVDLECHLPLRDMVGMMDLIASPQERNAWRCLDIEAQKSAFFTLWTRKEALVKGCGAGLSYGLTDLEAGFDLRENVPIGMQAMDWRVRSLHVIKGVSVALAVPWTQGPICEDAIVF